MSGERVRGLAGVGQVVWMAAVGVGALLFFSGMLRVCMWVGERIQPDVGLTFGFIGGMVATLVLWPQVLWVVWRARWAYLRRVGRKVAGTVVGSEVRKEDARFVDRLRLRLAVEFAHPEGGELRRVRKEFVVIAPRRGRVEALRERLPVGAVAPLLVRGRSAAIDVPDRPAWADIW